MVPEEISMKRMAQVKTRHRGDTKDRIPAVKNMASVGETKGHTHPFPPKQVL